MVDQPITEDSIVTRNTTIVTNNIENEVVMMSLEDGNYYGMSPVATRIWEIIDNSCSVDKICCTLLEEYQIDRENCLKGVIRFLQNLNKTNLIQISTHKT
jgi:hypothetical protein